MEAIFLTGVIGDSRTLLYRPLGAYQIAWYLRKHGYSAQVIDFIHHYDEADLIKMIGKFITKDTKMLGLGLMVNPYHSRAFLKKIEEILVKIKKRFPHIAIVAGGSSAEWWSRTQRNKKLFDYIFMGHTEDQVLSLLDHLCRNKPVPKFEVVDGNRILRETTPVFRDEKFDISECDHQWADNDYIQPGETLPIELGRGCVFKCRFCRYPHIGKHKNDFNRGMECIKNEFIQNYEKWGVTNYFMLDDTFNADHDRLKAFHAMTQTLPFKIKYTTYLRLDLLVLHPGSEHLLEESGLASAFFGIETFNQKTSDIIGKSWIGKNAKAELPRLYKDIWKEKILFQVGMIAGLPPETLVDCQKSNQWFIDNGISTWTWNALDINKDSHGQYRSEFDANAENFGFSWEMREGRYIWKTDYCDALIAREWARKLNDEAKPYRKFGNWQLLALASLGEDMEKYINQVQHLADWQHLQSKQQLFLDRYKKQILS